MSYELALHGAFQNLWGDDQLKKIQSFEFAVIGLGGVGSWAAEALVRSGVSKLRLIDFDDVCVSNVTRQIPATSSTQGRFKVEVLKERFLDISPSLDVQSVTRAVTKESVQELLRGERMVVLDAVDSLQAKVEIFEHCQRNSLPLVVSGSAGGRKDPVQVRTSSLVDTTNDALLAKMRKELRSRGWQLEACRNVRACYSTESMTRDQKLGEAARASGRPCDSRYASYCFLTGTFGFVLAHESISTVVKI